MPTKNSGAHTFMRTYVGPNGRLVYSYHISLLIMYNKLYNKL